MEFLHTHETLNLNIDFDEDTGLPLYEEHGKVLDLILNYLSLPYSIAEHGCGKKTSIILNKLLELGIPAFSLKRGMIMEKNMSADALHEEDYTKRPHALVIHNPLFETDIKNEILVAMLNERGVTTDTDKKEIIAKPYTLSHDPQLQFILARSHIFPIITFWNKEQSKKEELALDPTVDTKGIFSFEIMREKLNAPQSLIFKAPVLGDFMLDEESLTSEQYEELQKLLDGQSLSALNNHDYNALIRKMNKAASGTIGDPACWSYANNIQLDMRRYKILKGMTGAGNKIGPLFDQMLQAKQNGDRQKTQKIRDELLRISVELRLKEIIRGDALWSEAMLEPLAAVANTISYFHSFATLSQWIKSNEPITDHIHDADYEDSLHGLGVQLRWRIEVLGKLSINQDSEIDARALNHQFTIAATETIIQMARAGLKVFIDKVGNIHGLLIDDNARDDILKNPDLLPSITKKAVCHCSHIDTVQDAGKYDGRLGVLSGIGLAQFLHDMHRFHHVGSLYPATPNVMMVSAFIGEEMTFTGEDVSMPGSAAITGSAEIQKIYAMKNMEGETFKSGLVAFLKHLKGQQKAGHIDIMNDFTKASGEKLLAQCFEPKHFYTKHSYERHIEQGPALDRNQLPLVLVDTIMGIYQEDFYFNGDAAEQAALIFNKRLRDTILTNAFNDMRITVGIIAPLIKTQTFEDVDHGWRVHIHGEKNHAGATATQDRKDPGVAAARVADAFIEIIRALNKESDTPIKPIIGEITFTPRTNRNVIPAMASVSMGIMGGTAKAGHIKEKLENIIRETLSKPVPNGGEGVMAFYFDDITSVNMAHCVRSSIDLRGADPEKIQSMKQLINNILHDLKNKYSIDIERKIEQEMLPYPLSESGQVLQIERSYGGSHNPNEAELSKDLLRGTLIQLGVTWDFLNLDSADQINLHAFTKDRLPQNWKNVLNPFVSGALHDTCNIARKMLDDGLKNP